MKTEKEYSQTQREVVGVQLTKRMSEHVSVCDEVC